MIGTDFSSKRDQNRCSPTPPVGLHWDTSRAQKHGRIQFNNSTVIAAAAPYRIFASPRASDKTVHSEAAQAACNLKHADYSKHHTYPSDVFFPLAVERSGHLHPTFISFIDTFLARCSDTRLQPSVKLDVLYSVGHSITYMTAAFLKVAAFSLTPTSLKSLFPPPPFIPPLRWAPATLFHAPRHRTFGTVSHSTGHSRRRASSKAFVARSPQLTGRVTCDAAVSGPP